MDIYPILSSKPHNPHYLNRYIKFIEQCQQKNIDYDGPIENHHICPKADDMFPEYICFKTNPWNKAPLTPRQHYIAHIMLWKVFPNIDSTSQALHYMSYGKWKDHVKYSVIYEELMIIWRKNQIKISKKSNKERLENGTYHFKKVPCVDREGNVVMIAKEEFYSKKEAGCDEYVALSSKEGRFRKSGELNRRSKGLVPCVDKEGETVHIKREEYFEQKGPNDKWDFVHISSDEGIKRKNNGTKSRSETLNALLERKEVTEIKKLQKKLSMSLSKGWYQKSVNDLNIIISDLERMLEEKDNLSYKTDA